MSWGKPGKTRLRCSLKLQDAIQQLTFKAATAAPAVAATAAAAVDTTATAVTAVAETM